MFSKNKRALITGAAGFIGSHLFESLEKDGWAVMCIDNFSHPCARKMPNVTWADVKYTDDVDQYVKHADIVYHLAAQIHVDKSIEHVGDTLDTNITGTYNVLEACKRHNKRMVFASTSEIYGGHGGKIHEGTATYSQSPYATSKLAGDKLCGNYHQLYGTKVIRLRNFNTFGPWQNDGGYGAVIPIFTRQALQGKQLTIFGSGEQKRDFMYIDDCVAGYRLVSNISELEGEPINVGTGKSVSINKLGEMISKIAGVEFNPKYLPARAGEVKKLEADITLAKKHGYKLTVGLEEGLRKYIEWYKEHRLPYLDVK